MSALSISMLGGNSIKAHTTLESVTTSRCSSAVSAYLLQHKFLLGPLTHNSFQAAGWYWLRVGNAFAYYSKTISQEAGAGAFSDSDPESHRPRLFPIFLQIGCSAHRVFDIHITAHLHCFLSVHVLMILLYASFYLCDSI